MADDSDLEKTEQATPKRIEKAREDGDVPRSRELAACAVLFSAGLSLMMFDQSLGTALRDSLRSGLEFDRSMAFDPTVLLMKTSHTILDLLIAFAPIALVVIAVAVGAPILVGGWVFSDKVFVPKFNRLNPIQGISNMFSKNALAELVKSILKALLVSCVAYWVVKSDLEPILSLSNMPIQAGISEVNHLMLTGFITIVAALIFIAAIDVPYQLYQYAEKLKMTKQQIKDESKETDGNPEIKGKIRQQQREMARRRMMSKIPTADVVITNPTHYAVAVKYQEQGMSAPIVVAKGADAVALKIRELAKEHKIVILESPKLARALYAHTELDKEIPEALYAAVAEVLAYVFQLRMFKQQGGFQPDVPKTLPVPDALDPHSLIPAPNLMTNGGLA
ncbi:MAG: flagellar biosynthesis protein FlhB [Methylophilus sp.]|nr:flagellar biosynthesis protein FlhB [Methylophilus sp.]MDP3608287.1 flagellar biosynthesis protein FlhB [Methylophilus sp.]